MKITTFLLLAFFMQVSATGFGQKITLSERRATLENIFEKIRKQSGYDFFYEAGELKKANTVAVQVTDASIDEVLKSIFKNQPFSYTIKNKTVIITEKETSLMDDLRDKVAGLFQQEIMVKIILKDDKGNTLPGGSAMMLSTNQIFRADESGFIFFKITKNENVRFTYVGYQPKEIIITLSEAKNKGGNGIIVSLNQNPVELKEVSIASNGYQKLDPTRTTGSIEVITAKQLQHSNSPNLIRRLEGITTSTVFNNQNIPTNPANISINGSLATLGGQFLNSPLTNLTIRGKNTLSSKLNVSSSFGGLGMENTSGIPLVVIDGIANPYSIDLVDPETVESITILKDAAAASIWGSRAANGVIVVTTKKSNYDRPTNISFNANVNITEKMNLFYKKTMSISDYIDAQVLAYNRTNSNSALPNPISATEAAQTYMSPVFEIMNTWKLNPTPSTLAERDIQLDALRGNDIRNDFDKYFLRNALNQNYNLSISGGSKKVNYNLSGAYSKTLNNTQNSGQDRVIFNYSSSARPVKNLELYGNINYSVFNVNDQAAQNRISGLTDPTFYPYTRLADDAGNALEVPKSYRPVFVKLLESTYGTNILGMRYKPLEDVNEGYQKLKNQNLNFNLGANYFIMPWLNANVNYSYSKGNIDETLFYGQNSFYMRNLINLYTNVSGTTFTRKIPLGGAYQPSVTKSDNQVLRTLLNVNQIWNQKHEFSAIVGVDVTQNHAVRKIDGYYGYDPLTLQYNPKIDYNPRVTFLFPKDIFTTGNTIPFVSSAPSISDFKTRTFSVFSNMAYTYDKRYTISASVRKDGDSQFGLGTNRTGSPFYSLGSAWNINEEKFYKLDWLPYLKLRATFGYNGNTNPLTIGRPKISLSTGTEFTGLFSANNIGFSVANRNLRPEKTRVLNLGLDFGIKGNRVSGSLEYYDKRTTDLLASNIVDPSLGYTSATFNTANLHGYGLDFTLNTLNVKSGLFDWRSNFLLSYNRTKVTKLYVGAALKVRDVVYGSIPYNEGYDLSRLFAYKWAGLDPQTGDPRGYLQGQPVSIDVDGSNLGDIDDQPLSEAYYAGSAVPVWYGAFRHTFTYGKISLSANFMYKLGYFFRRPVSDVVSYSGLFNTNTNRLQGSEYAQRWLKPGDELTTNVPSLVYTSGDSYRDDFYYYSEVNVLKGDHVRLQEINLNYSIVSKKNWFLKNSSIYFNVSNLGVIWRANKLGLDPDIYDYPEPRQYSIGFRANF